MIRTPTPFSFCKTFCPCFSGYSSKSKNGLITLDGNHYFPKEYLEPDERKEATNPVEELSDYLRNIVHSNPFDKSPDEDNESEGEGNSLRRDSQPESVSQSFRSYDNQEENKSLMQDFQQRNLPISLRGPENFHAVANNMQGENSKEDDVSSPGFHLPMIKSDRSSDKNSEKRDDSCEKQENYESNLAINFDSGKVPLPSLVSLQKQSIEKESLSKNLNSYPLSKRDSPKRKVKVDNMLDSLNNIPFIDQVYPFQYGFNEENIQNNFVGKNKNITKRPQKVAMITNFSKSVETFHKVDKTRDFKVKHKR